MSHIDLDCVENGHLHQATSGKELLKTITKYQIKQRKLGFLCFCGYNGTTVASISKKYLC